MYQNVLNPLSIFILKSDLCYLSIFKIPKLDVENSHLSALDIFERFKWAHDVGKNYRTSTKCKKTYESSHFLYVFQNSFVNGNSQNVEIFQARLLVSRHLNFHFQRYFISEMKTKLFVTQTISVHIIQSSVVSSTSRRYYNRYDIFLLF